jgi:hypothetical protein
MKTTGPAPRWSRQMSSRNIELRNTEFRDTELNGSRNIGWSFEREKAADN